MPELINVTDQHDLVDTSKFSLSTFPFEKFNPIQSRLFEFYNTPGNVVISSSTGSGKTACCEMLFSHELQKRGGACLYVGPQKSLMQEKINDWLSAKHSFGKLNSSICTGDYRFTANRVEELANANLVLMTFEMWSSCLRNFKSDKNSFLSKIGTIVVDECFPGQTKIRVCSNMELTIKRIVKDDSITHVLAYDETMGSIAPHKILRKITRKRDTGLIRIKHEYGRLTCTEDHKIWTTIGYVKAKDLTAEHYIKWIPSNNKLMCDLCNREFVNQKGLTAHVLYNHLSPGTNAKHIDDEKVCKKCGKLVSVYGYLSHMEACGKPPKPKPQPRLNCDICGKEFKSLLSRCIHENHHFRTRESYDKANETKKTSEKFKAHCERMSKDRQGKDNPIFRHPDTISKISQSHKERWKNLPESEKQAQLTRFMNAPLNKTSGTKLELFVENVVKDLPIRRTSGGKFWLTFKNKKRKNPDFKVNGQRKVIEVGDTEYWHTAEEIQETILQYDLIGYQCLYLTNKDVLLGEPHVKNKIEFFLNNHTSKVLEIKPWGRGGIETVYDLEIEKCHNYFANGVLVSNCHNLSAPGRGDKLEVAIMKHAQLNPNCRFVGLSATMPNVGDIAGWLSKLTKRDTYILESKYRPVPLFTHFRPYDDSHWKYAYKELSKVHAALQIIKEYPNDKFIVFAHGKPTGELMMEALQKAKIECAFHNANIVAKKRVELENRFREDPKLMVVVATSTLEAGINMPARRVIILGIHRGLDEVDINGIGQQCGRAGRPKYDIRGDAYILLPQKTIGKHILRFQNPPLITSQLINPQSRDHRTLAFHVVNEIHQGNIESINQIYEWYEQTFGAYQSRDLNDELVHSMVEQLIKRGIIKQEDDKLVVTAIGKIASMFYYSPFDIADLKQNFTVLFDHGQEFDETWLSVALANIDSNKTGIVSANEREQMEAFVKRIGVDICKAFIGYKDFSDGVKKMAYCNKLVLNGTSNVAFVGPVNGLRNDCERIMEVLNALDGMAAKWDKADYFRKLRKRLTTGASWELLGLCEMRGLGKVKSKKLWDANLRTVADIASKPTLVKLVLNCSDKVAEKLVEQAKKLVESN